MLPLPLMSHRWLTIGLGSVSVAPSGQPEFSGQAPPAAMGFVHETRAGRAVFDDPSRLDIHRVAVGPYSPRRGFAA